ncbi:DDE Tnp4 domain-containing protein [Lachancea thermotolerans]
MKTSDVERLAYLHQERHLKNDGFCEFIENVATNQYLLRYTYGNLVIRRATNKLTQRTPQLVLETLEDNGVFHNEERILIEKFTEQLIANQIQFETRKSPEDESDFDRVVEALKIPSYIGAYSLDAFECFFIFIVRLKSGCTYTVLTSLCGWEASTISRIITFVTCYLFHIASPCLSVTNASWLAGRLANIDQSLLISSRSISNSRIVGFIDGTHVKIALPHGNARLENAAYSGHKKTHTLKYQAVTTPNGICIDLAGPFAGSQHDSFLFANSGLYRRLKPALKVGDLLTVGYKGQNLTNGQKEYNKILSGSRVSIEWFFGAVKNNFQIFNILGRLKVGGVRFCGAYFTSAVFLTNLKHCLEGSQGSKYFNISPPRFEEYMNGLKFPQYFDGFLIDVNGTGSFFSKQYEHLSFDRLGNIL